MTIHGYSKERKKIIRKLKENRRSTLKSCRIFYDGIRGRINDCVDESGLVRGNLFHFAGRLAPLACFRLPFDSRLIFAIELRSYHSFRVVPSYTRSFVLRFFYIATDFRCNFVGYPSEGDEISYIGLLSQYHQEQRSTPFPTTEPK